MVLKEDDFVVIAEFKFSKMKLDMDIPIKSYEKMLKETMEQIKMKKYHEKYSDKKIIAIAIVFAGKQLKTQTERIRVL